MLVSDATSVTVNDIFAPVLKFVVNQLSANTDADGKLSLVKAIYERVNSLDAFKSWCGKIGTREVAISREIVKCERW